LYINLHLNKWNSQLAKAPEGALILFTARDAYRYFAGQDNG